MGDKEPAASTGKKYVTDNENYSNIGKETATKNSNKCTVKHIATPGGRL